MQGINIPGGKRERGAGETARTGKTLRRAAALGRAVLG